MSKLIIMEGLDGSGKSTQTALLEKYFSDSGINFKKIKLPDYDSPSSTLVNMYLGGEFGSNANDVNAYAAGALLCAVYCIQAGLGSCALLGRRKSLTC